MAQALPVQAAPATVAVVHTEALRRVLAQPMHHSAVADYLFLEAWERAPSGSAGSALRIGQIRRANPVLAAEIRAEVNRSQRAALRQ